MMTSFHATRSARAAAVRQGQPEKRRLLPLATSPAANDNARGRGLFLLLRDGAGTVILGALAGAVVVAGIWAIALVSP